MRKLFLASIMFSSVLSAQSAKESPSVDGACNGTAVGNNVTIVVNCANGLSKTQAKELADRYSKILEQVRKSNLSLDEVIERLKSLQSGVDTIKTSVGSRHLSSDQAEALRSLSNSPAFDRSTLVVTNYSDPEATGFAREFLSALGIPDFSMTMMGATSPDVGIVLSISDDDFIGHQSPPVCDALVRVFQSQGIVFVGRHSKMIKSRQCGLTIGLKPPVE
jgi:hypothetical protein